MQEIRFYGRGGQGLVVASYVLANALFLEDKYVQAFPFFGVERRGSPVLATTRFADEPIRKRSLDGQSDYLVVFDPGTDGCEEALTRLRPGGFCLVNTNESPKMYEAAEAIFFDANEVAVRHGLGSAETPIINTVLLGAFAGATGLASMDHLAEAMRGGYVPARLDSNIAAAREAYERFRS